MKNKLVFLFTAFAIIASPALAKENEIKTGSVKNTELNTVKKDTREDIQPFNFSKLFSEAENYFKAAKAWEVLKCEPKSGFICTKHECVKRNIKATVTLDKKNGTITRCEGKNCETFEAKFNQTGVYINVQTEGPVGTLIRILGDSRYKEITTIGLDAYIANGNCEVVGEVTDSEKSKD
jgi:hypothetical protein